MVAINRHREHTEASHGSRRRAASRHERSRQNPAAWAKIGARARLTRRSIGFQANEQTDDRGEDQARTSRGFNRVSRSIATRTTGRRWRELNVAACSLRFVDRSARLARGLVLTHDVAVCIHDEGSRLLSSRASGGFNLLVRGGRAISFLLCSLRGRTLLWGI